MFFDCLIAHHGHRPRAFCIFRPPPYFQAVAQIPQGGWGYFAALRIVHDTGKEPVWDHTCFRSVFLSSNSEVASAFFQGSGVLIQCALCFGIVRILDLQEQISYEVCSGARQRALVTIQPTLPTLPKTRCIEGRFRRYHSGQKQYHVQLPRLGSHLCRQHRSSCH